MSHSKNSARVRNGATVSNNNVATLPNGGTVPISRTVPISSIGIVPDGGTVQSKNGRPVPNGNGRTVPNSGTVSNRNGAIVPDSGRVSSGNVRTLLNQFNQNVGTLSIPNGQISGQAMDRLSSDFSGEREASLSSLSSLWNRDDLKQEQSRLKTFEGVWTKEDLIPGSELARDGFRYCGPEDSVQCVYCQGTLTNWVPGDRAQEEHDRHFQTCPFVLGYDVGNVPRQGFSDPRRKPHLGAKANADGETNSDAAKILPTPGYPQFVSEASRLKSFEGWRMGNPQGETELAKAGLFYLDELLDLKEKLREMDSLKAEFIALKAEMKQLSTSKADVDQLATVRADLSSLVEELFPMEDQPHLTPLSIDTQLLSISQRQDVDDNWWNIGKELGFSRKQIRDFAAECDTNEETMQPAIYKMLQTWCQNSNLNTDDEKMREIWRVLENMG